MAKNSHNTSLQKPNDTSNNDNSKHNIIVLSNIKAKRSTSSTSTKTSQLSKQTDKQTKGSQTSKSGGGNNDLIDYYKLALAIAKHETGICKLGYGRSHNNATGIMKNGKPKYFNTCEESLQETIRIWKIYYGGMPTIEKAKRWSGDDRPVAWLNNVINFYNQL